MSIVANFLRRWSTIDITLENSMQFDLELVGIKALAKPSELRLLEGLDSGSKRADFGARYRKLIKEN